MEIFLLLGRFYASGLKLFCILKIIGYKKILNVYITFCLGFSLNRIIMYLKENAPRKSAKNLWKIRVAAVLYCCQKRFLFCSIADKRGKCDEN